MLKNLTGNEIRAVVTKLDSSGRLLQQRVIDSSADKGVGREELKIFIGRLQITQIEVIGEEPKYQAA